MNDERPDPDALLSLVQAEEARRDRGALKVFFGYAAGVGKTYAMLQAARRAGSGAKPPIIGGSLYVSRDNNPSLSVVSLTIESDPIGVDITIEQVMSEALSVIDGGIPVWRAAVFVNTLHPDIFGRRFIASGDARAVKSLPEFIRMREEVIGLIHSTLA